MPETLTTDIRAMWSAHVDPRHEISDSVRRMTIGESGERFGQPGVGGDGGDLADFDQRGDALQHLGGNRRLVGEIEEFAPNSRIHRKKPRGKPRSERLRAANRVKSKIRARVEHVFAQEKAHMALFIRTIGIKRAESKIILVNLAYNMKRLIFHERRTAAA